MYGHHCNIFSYIILNTLLNIVFKFVFLICLCCICFKTNLTLNWFIYLFECNQKAYLYYVTIFCELCKIHKQAHLNKFQDLQRNNPKLFPNPVILGMLQFDWDIFIDQKRKVISAIFHYHPGLSSFSYTWDSPYFAPSIYWCIPQTLDIHIIFHHPYIDVFLKHLTFTLLSIIHILMFSLV